MFPDDSCRSTQGLVDLSRTRKHGRHIGIKDYNHTARCVGRRIFVRPGATEVVLRKYLVDIDSAGFSNFAPLCLHNFPTHRVSRTIFDGNPQLLLIMAFRDNRDSFLKVHLIALALKATGFENH
jgi:hypothetical protein